MCPFALCHDYGFKFIRFHLSTSSHTHDETGERERTNDRTNRQTKKLASHRASNHFRHTVLYDGIVPAKEEKTHTHEI